MAHTKRLDTEPGMRHFAFYISDKPGNGRQWVRLPGEGQARYAYIRVVEVPDADSDFDALNRMQKPRRDESVMNTHSFEGGV